MTYKEEFVIEKGVLREYNGHSRRVVVPEGVTELGDRVFAFREWINEIVLPSTLRRIGRRAFFNGAFGRIVIPASVREVARRAFENCKHLEEAVFEGEKIKLGKLVFAGCKRLRRVRLPDEVVLYDVSAFDGCTELECRTYGNGRYLGNENNGYVVCLGAAEGNVRSIRIHEDTKTLPFGAFNACPELQELVLPRYYPTLSKPTTEKMRYLRRVEFLPGTQKIGKNAFVLCDALEELILPEGLRVIEKNAFSFCRKLTDVRFPESLYAVRHGAFLYTPALPGRTMYAELWDERIRWFLERRYEYEKANADYANRCIREGLFLWLEGKRSRFDEKKNISRFFMKTKVGVLQTIVQYKRAGALRALFEETTRFSRRAIENALKDAEGDGETTAVLLDYLTERFGEEEEREAEREREAIAFGEKKDVRQEFDVCYNPDDSYSLKKYLGDERRVLLPARYEGAPCRLNCWTFYKKPNTREIIVPSEMKEVDLRDLAFSNGIRKVTFLGTETRVRDCSWDDHVTGKMTICGKKGSIAEKFALRYDRRFEELKDDGI